MEPFLLLAVLTATVLLALACARGVLALVFRLMSDRAPVQVAFSAVRPSPATLPVSEHAQV